MSVYELQVSGSERYAKLSSFRAELQLNGHDNLIAFILPTEGSPEVRFELDDEVELLKDSTPITGGIVTHVGEEMEPEGGPSNNGRFLSRITVSGWGEIASRRHVTIATAGGSPGTALSAFLAALIALDLGADGVTLHPSQDAGDSLPAMEFEDELPSAILNRLALITGRVWRIDEQKRLRMWAKGDIAAAFDIDEDDLPAKYFGDIRPSRARFEGYANRVIVKGTKQTILDYGESHTSTGVETSFTLSVPMIGTRQSAVGTTNVPSLGIASNQTLFEGLGPVGSGSDWEYDTATGVFTRLAGALPSGAIVRLVADAEVSPRGVANDAPDQALFPVRDEIVHAPVTTDAEAQALADQILPYLVAAKETKAAYSSRETDIIWPGVTQNMTAPRRGLGGAFLVERNVLRSGPGEMNTYLVQDIENTLNDVLKGDWRDLLNQFTVGPSGSTTTGGGGDSNNNGGDTITNPDGDGGSGSNLNIPPADTDVLINKHGALGTVRSYRGHIQALYERAAAIIAGGSPSEVDMVQLLLTTLSETPEDSLQKWQSTTGGSPDVPSGVIAMNPGDDEYMEQTFGYEKVEGVDIARSSIVGLLSHTATGTGNFGLTLYGGQTPGSPVDFNTQFIGLALTFEDVNSPGGAMFLVADDTSSLVVNQIGLTEAGAPTSTFGMGIRHVGTLSAGRLLQIQLGDAARTIRFDGVGTPVTFT